MFVEQSSRQLRQQIDATAVFTALTQARKAAAAFEGSMFWREVKGTRYLIRSTPSGAQKSLGPMTEDKRDVVEHFMEKKQMAEARVKSLTQELAVHQKLNRALRVGRAPPVVVDAINAIDNAGLSEHFIVVETQALYAYETAAGVLIPDDAMATQDVDLLFDSRKRVKFFTKMQRLDSSFLSVLRKADKTFRLRDDQLYTAVNDKGFEVDVIRRYAGRDDPHPLRLSDDEDEFWAVQVSTGAKLLSARPFEQVIVSTAGGLARMRTIHPLDFARIKRELGAMPSRDAAKYRKDFLQAQLVTEMVHAYLPNLAEREDLG